MFHLLIFLVTLSVRALRAIFRTRRALDREPGVEAVRVAAQKKERPRPVLDDLDRAFRVALRTSCPGWACRLLNVTPDTVARWHRDLFRRYWTKIPRERQGASGRC